MTVSLQEATDGATEMVVHSLGGLGRWKRSLSSLHSPGVSEVGEGSGPGVRETRQGMKEWETRGG